MSNNNWLSTLGLATRARKTVTGEELVLKEVRSGRAKLVILAADASQNTAKKVQDKCKYYQIPVKVVSDRFELGRAIGKETRVVIALVDQGFAKKILSMLD